MGISDIDALLGAVGPLDDAILAVVRTGEDAWTLRFEDLDVDVEFDAQSERLMLSAVVGPVPATRAAKIHEMLLIYGLIWRETGAVRLALTGPGGEAVQMVDLFAPQASPEALVVLASNLAERTRIWRDLIADDPDAPDGAADGAPDMNMIRV